MKKLIKYYSNTDPKMANYQFGDNYGSFNDILVAVVAGNGFNPTDVSKIVTDIDNKKVEFTFKTPKANHGYKVGEVVNLSDNKNQEYVILEVTDTMMKCEYYETYTIVDNPVYTGQVLNSSLGFKLESNDIINGKLTISDEYKVSKFIFHDVSSDNFANGADKNKVVGMYMHSYNNPAIRAPQDKTNLDYNNNVEWNVTTSTSTKRRCLMNLGYVANQNYTIIGNGNFFYFITGLDSQATKDTPYAFGTFKKYIDSDIHNALITSKAVRISSSPITQSTELFTTSAYNTNLFDHIDIDKRLLSTANLNINIAAMNAISGDNWDIANIITNQQVLSGMSSSSAFCLVPSTGFGDTFSGGGGVAYPNASNKLFLSDINIFSGVDSGTARNETIRGKMPFAYWYGHPISTAGANRSVVVINDNGKLRSFYILNNSATKALAYIEITPNAYDNYYLE